MPRVTRAALRSNAILEDESNLAMSTPLPSTPQKERGPLGEVAGNISGELPVFDDASKVGKKGGAKGKKAKGIKKGKEQPKLNDEEPTPEVLDDDNQSATSSAVEEACEDLMKPSSGETYQIPMQDRPSAPQSEAVEAVGTRLTANVAQTPHFNPEIHRSEDGNMEVRTNDQEDSFVGTIGSRTPAKFTRTEETVDEENNGETIRTHGSEDSFVEKIVARSPAKPITRIEDSVEAIDALEDAIEKVGESLPTVLVDPQSPVTTKKASNVVGGRTSVTASKTANKKTNAMLSNSRTKKLPARRPSTISTAPSSAKRAIFRPSNISSTRPSISAKTPSQTSSSAAVKPTTTKRPVSSTHKAPFQPTKSTKPPTRPSFELPGEAISRKLKEQREERLQREEEEKSKKRQFKARPVRLSQAPVIKPTAASKARMSLLHLGAESTTNDHAPKIKPLARASSTSNEKRLSTLSVAKRSTVPARAPADTSAPRAPSLAGSGSSTSRQPSTAAQQKLRGKEVCQRDRHELEEKEKARRQKEEAARKARAEAAERGRKASREWAEKMKAKKMAKTGEATVGRGEHVTVA